MRSSGLKISLLSYIKELAAHQRADGVSSLVYEANARMRDPVYVRVGAISYLQSQVSQLQMQSAVAQAEILKVQMQQDSRVRGLVHSHIETADEKCLSFVSNDITSNVQQYFNSGLSRQYCNREPSQLNERVPLEINFPLQSHPYIKS